jgi:hypothetical protein
MLRMRTTQVFIALNGPTVQSVRFVERAPDLYDIFAFFPVAVPAFPRIQPSCGINTHFPSPKLSRISMINNQTNHVAVQGGFG